eukprot:TRINITY_DN71033_c0_g1_i1.p1 TRINITY_DN71033_c0_g1~~TRINITY_DN71033_c0_g1_i1.p1  ORF type:complete len:265 (-),score=61.96 TRINITY_DN71033_c0_g1_i1:159-902(-)
MMDFDDYSEVTPEDMAARLQWDVDEVGVWLEKEGLASLVPQFEEQKINGLTLLTHPFNGSGTVQIADRQKRRDLIDAVERLKHRCTIRLLQEWGELSSVDHGPTSPKATPPPPEVPLTHQQQLQATLQQNMRKSPLQDLKRQKEVLEFQQKQAEKWKERGEMHTRPTQTKQLSGNIMHTPLQDDDPAVIQRKKKLAAAAQQQKEQAAQAAAEEAERQAGKKPSSPKSKEDYLQVLQQQEQELGNSSK